MEAPSVPVTQPSLEIDWRQYFLDFCEAHGKYPIEHKGLLLFPDGYRYSSTDYLGPEYPPPTDAKRLRELQMVYWHRRHSIVRSEERELVQLIRDLEQLQLVRSVGLKQSVSYVDEDGKTVTTSSPVDIQTMKTRLEWLRRDISDCLKELTKLGHIDA